MHRLDCSSLFEVKAVNVDRAKEYFRKVSSRDIGAYGLNGRGRDAIQLFRRIPPEMIAEKTYVFVWNACSHSVLVDEAREIFSNIRVKSKWNYTAVVNNFNVLTS